MRIYIAGASAEIERAEHWASVVREAGHTITEDWMAAVRAAVARGDGANTGSPEALAAAAEADERGVFDAQLVWVLRPLKRNATAGAWYEMRCALEGGFRAVVVSDPDGVQGQGIELQACVFMYRPRVVRFESDREAWTAIQAYAKVAAL